MKSIKRYSIWIVVSLVLQMSLYLYLDKFFFVNETSFKTKKIEEVKKVTKVVENIKIPEKSTNLTLSYDGKYASYFEGGSLKVINTQTAEEKAIPFEQGLSVSFCKWLPDRDRMFIAEKKVDKDTSSIKFSYYDVKTKEKTVLRDVSINLRDVKADVQNMEFSTLTNVIYVKVGRKGNASSIYRINVMESMEKVTTGLIGNIKIMTREDKMLYEDIRFSQIKTAGSDKVFKIKDANKLSLISIDKEDNVYVGQIEQGKIVKIFYGALSQNTDTWKVTELKEPTEIKDIFVSLEGRTYVNDNLRGIVTDITSSKETSYIGSFLEMNNNVICSLQGNVLLQTTIK